MKWSVAGLIVMGIVGALCASVLVASLRVGQQPPGPAENVEPTEVEVLVASKPLPAPMVVDGKSFISKTVPKAEAPKNFISSPVKIIGRLLAVSMTEGQPFTSRCFVQEGSPLEISRAIPEGMRVVSISLAQHAGLDGLLYPGSMVDILASFKIPSSQPGRAEAISNVLIEGVEVLGIGDQTIVSGPKEDYGKAVRGKAGRNIALLLEAREAKILQLAMQNGSVSLAMRNPLDTSRTSGAAARLAQLTAEGFYRRPESRRMVPIGTTAHPTAWVPNLVMRSGQQKPPAKPDSPSPPEQVEPIVPVARWETIVIRAGKIENMTFPMPEAER